MLLGSSLGRENTSECVFHVCYEGMELNVLKEIRMRVFMYVNIFQLYL